MRQMWNSMPVDKRDIVYSRLIARIMKRCPHSWDDMLCLLPEISAALTEQQLIGLIAFINAMFIYGDGVCLKRLIRQSKHLLSRTVTKKLFFSFFALLDNILAYSSSYVIDELLEFADFFQHKIPIEQREVPTSMLCNMITQREPESAAAILRFLARMAPILSDSDVETLRSVIEQYRLSNIVFLRLCAVAAFGDLIGRFKQPEPIFYNVLIAQILTDKNDIVKCDSLRVMSSLPYLCEPHLDHILKLSKYKSWKIKLALVNASLALINFPKMHVHFISQCKSQDLYVREYSLRQLAEAIHNGSSMLSDAKSLIPVQLQNQHPPILAASLKLLDEILIKDPSFLAKCADIFDPTTTDDPAVLYNFLLTIFSRTPTPTPDITALATTWLESHLTSEQWQDTLDALNLLLVCHDRSTNSAVISTTLPLLQRLESDPRAAIRSAASACLERLRQ